MVTDFNLSIRDKDAGHVMASKIVLPATDPGHTLKIAESAFSFYGG